MLAEGTVFRCGIEIGVDVTADQLRGDHDAIVLAGGCTVPRGLPVPGADLDGIHQAMEYLPLANRAVADGLTGAGDGRSGPAVSSRPARGPALSALGRHVVIIGGGDTGADRLRTVLPQGAGSVAPR